MLSIDYRPRFPAGYTPGIGLIGCGRIVRSAHLPAYKKYGVRLAGAYDISSAATVGLHEEFGVEQVYDDLDSLLANPEIEVVDIGTHPAQRVALIHRALDAGKHVLAQKPLALTVAEAREVVAKAERLGLKFAVNQNGRWSPPWRIATQLVEQGAVGDVLSVTHLFETSFAWVAESHFDSVPHWGIYDYSIHWIDISRCWMQGKRIAEVRAREHRPPHQPATAQADWGFQIELIYSDGAHALIWSPGYAKTSRPSHPFWIYGSAGTIRGSTLNADAVELERDGITQQYTLEGTWFPDGFAGTLGELCCAIAESREPYNSARHNLLSLQLTLAACQSAEQDGRPIPVEEVVL